MLTFITLCYYCWKLKFGRREILFNTETTPTFISQSDFRAKDTYKGSRTTYRSTRDNENMSCVQKYKIILCVDSVTSESSRSLLRQIQLTIRDNDNFTNQQECIRCIKEYTGRILLVTTNEKTAVDILSECGSLSQLEAIYVLNSNGDSIVDKKVVYFQDSIALTLQIASVTQVTQQQSSTISCLNQNQRTMSELSKEAAQFMWSQMLLEVLKQFSTDEYSLEDMLEKCRDHYHGDKTELGKIEKFRMDYNPSDTIKWYTKDSFLYRQLNEALRTTDIDALFTFRVFIVNLCSQLQKQQRLEPFSTSIVTLYRGQTMSAWELDKFIQNINQLISINAFFSTTLDECVAESFSISDLFDTWQRSVIFQIKVYTGLKNTIFARIDRLSENREEEEVLFNLFTVFKIVDVVEEYDKHRWRIYLEATDDGRKVLDEYIHVSKSDAEIYTNEVIFGRTLMHMGQYRRAIKYFTLLISRLDSNDLSNYAAIISNQSDCFYNMCKYEEARLCLEDGFSRLDHMHMSKDDKFYLRCRFSLANLFVFTNRLEPARIIYEETLLKQRRILSPDHVHIADTLKAIGNWYGNKIGYYESLTYWEEALSIYEKSLAENHPKRISSLVSLAGAYEGLGRFEKALDYLHQARQIQNRYLPEDHSSRAETIRSIGINEQALGNWDRAFHNYCEAYSIWMLQFPQGHVYTAYCLNLIGSIYRIRRQFDHALECQLSALAMRKSLFPPGTLQPHSSLGLTYLDMGDNEKAIQTFKLACCYWQAKTDSSSNMYLNSIETYLATAYSHMGHFEEAQEIFERVLVLQRRAHPHGHPDVGFSLHHMASNLVRMNNYEGGMTCYQESLNMLSKFFKADHYEIQMVREKMQTLSTLMKKIQTDETIV